MVSNMHCSIVCCVECQYCLSVVMPGVVMLNVIMLGVFMLSVVTLSIMNCYLSGTLRCDPKLFCVKKMTGKTWKIFFFKK